MQFAKIKNSRVMSKCAKSYIMYPVALCHVCHSVNLKHKDFRQRNSTFFSSIWKVELILFLQELAILAFWWSLTWNETKMIADFQQTEGIVLLVWQRGRESNNQ